MNDELGRRKQLHLEIMKNFIPHTQLTSKSKHRAVSIKNWQVQVRTTVVIVTLASKASHMPQNTDMCCRKNQWCCYWKRKHNAFKNVNVSIKISHMDSPIIEIRYISEK
jgi:hypothetical protein